MPKIIISIIFFNFICFAIMAQEYLFDIENIQLQNYSKIYWKNKDNIEKSKQKQDTLELPFFDDFSNSYIYPDSTKWIDKYAFIGHNYAIDPVSIGTVTLDAIDQYGYVYSHLPYDNTGIADYLTSVPINLEYNAEDSIYLSFYYQAGGRGNTPEYRDSLVLEFKTPQTDWKSVWRMPGGENMDYFKIAMVTIKDPVWLTKGFQFRFKNYVSLTSLYELSWASNVDHWHIDFIKIDTGRFYLDTIPNDIAMIENISSLLEGYESVPWKHYKSADHSGMINNEIKFVYKNSRNEILNTNRQFKIIDMLGNDPGYQMLEDNENINPFETITYNRAFDYAFDSDVEDSASFMVKVFLDSGVDEEAKYRWNDTVRYYQNFFNYYAYDDGTAEKGYGIAGQGSAYSQLALRFNPLTSDTLRGVYMFFNHVLNEENQRYFFLTIWGDNNGVPGDTLYQEIGVLPDYSDDICGFTYYPLDSAIFINNTFYIGWVKTTDHMLNIGFDVNRVSNQHLFFNTTGEWKQSSAQGAVMIRPVFGKNPYPLVNYNIIAENTDFEIYPNPANNFINFSLSSQNKPEIIEIYDINGRILIKTPFADNIDVSNLSQGIYFVRPISEIEVFETKRLLIVK